MPAASCLPVKGFATARRETIRMTDNGRSVTDRHEATGVDRGMTGVDSSGYMNVNERFDDVNGRPVGSNERFVDSNKRVVDSNGRFVDFNERAVDSNETFVDSNERAVGSNGTSVDSNE
jgi:hypothetical protein